MPTPGAPLTRLAVLAVFAALGLAGPGCEDEPVEAVTVELRVAPAAVDFGPLPLGAIARRPVAIANGGNGPWQPDVEPVLEGEAFEIVRPCALPVAPRGFCEVEIAFRPRREGEQIGRLVVTPPAGDPLVVSLRGVAEPADLIVSPELIAFGPVSLGESVRRAFTVESRAGSAIDVTAAVDGAGFFVDGAGERALHLEPGETVTVEIDFAPSRGGAHAGSVVLELCGDGCGPTVALSGDGLAPRIDASPRAVDLGEVARGTSVSAEVQLKNLGAGDLVVTRLDLLTPTPELSLDAVELPLVIGEADAATLTLHYTPSVSRARLGAAIQVRSNDPVSPEVHLPVEAVSPGAAIDVLPRVAHFGVLDQGEERALDVVLRSTGTAPANVTSISLEGAAFFLDVPPPSGTLAPGESLLLTVRARASAASVSNGGESGTLTVRADGVEDVPLPLAFLSGTAGCQPRAPAPNAVLGSVVLGQGTNGAVVVTNIGDAQCTLEDAREADGFPFDPGFSFSATRVRVLPPGGSGVVDFAFRPFDVGQRSAFLALAFVEQPAPLFVSATARGVTGRLTADPALIEVGPLVEGCTSDVRTATFVNRGGDAVAVSRLDLTPADAPFAVSFPSVPTSVAAGGVLAVPLASVVAPAGVYEADLTATADGDAGATVRLRLVIEPPGEPIVEVFEATDAARVDVLFVVDNSLSMLDDQEILANNFGRFIGSAFAEGDVSVHIGVTTTDVIGGTGGPLVGPFLTDGSADLEARFAAQALVGTEGAGIELGLEAMRRALQDLSATTNAGFLRDDAALSVVLVSDEEDNGGLPGLDAELQRPVESYIESLQALKGGNIDNTPVLVSVVVDPAASARYRTVAEAFGGTVLDIRTGAWGEELSTVGAATFGLRRLFRLGSEPQPDSVRVTVDGRSTTAFSVDSEAKTVVLDTAPPPGALVEISYVAGCG